MTSYAEPTPDLFADQPDARPPTGVSLPPSFHHAHGDWENGYWLNLGYMPRPEWRSYDQDMLSLVREKLADGPKDYSDICDAIRREHGRDGPLQAGPMLVSHLRYLVLTGELVEHKRYFGASDARDPGYRGWHPRFELTERAEA